MIPSDHFVRFYNEIFKFLEKNGSLEDYFREVSRHQETHCLETFRTKGLQGVYEYYQMIRREENCGLEIILLDHCLILDMVKCPSLSKALDNDAGACRSYCLHCPGWTMPVYQKAGLFQIFDIGELDEPRCCEWIFDDRTAAEEKYRELARTLPPQRLLKSF